MVTAAASSAEGHDGKYDVSRNPDKMNYPTRTKSGTNVTLLYYMGAGQYFAEVTNRREFLGIQVAENDLAHSPEREDDGNTCWVN